jgi:hypothetical protein
MIKSPMNKPVLMHLQLVAGAAEGRGMDHAWALRRLVPCSTELRLIPRHRQQEAQALVIRMLEEARDQSPRESERVSYTCSKAATTALSCSISVSATERTLNTSMIGTIGTFTQLGYVEQRISNRASR